MDRMPLNLPSKANITFGVDIEFLFCIPNDTIDVYTPNQGDLAREEKARHYVSDLLSHRLGLPHYLLEDVVIQYHPFYLMVDNRPTFLSPVITPHSHAPFPEQTWRVINEPALRMSYTTLANRIQLPVEAVEYLRERWTIARCALISPIFTFSSPESIPTEQLEASIWLPMLTQIQQDLENPSPDPNMVAMVNNSGDLAIRVGISFENPNIGRYNAADLTLQTVKNAYILYAVCEEGIERLHPESRSSLNNPSVRSIRVPFTPPNSTSWLYSHNDLAIRINAARSLDDLDLLLNGFFFGPGNPRGHLPAKINIAPREDGKPVTLVFCEAAATLDAQQMRWWIRFTCGLVKLASKLACAQMPLLDYSGDGTFWTELKTSLMDRLDLGEEGEAYFNHRITQFDAEKAVSQMTNGYQEETYSDYHFGDLANPAFDFDFNMLDPFLAQAPAPIDDPFLAQIADPFQGHNFGPIIDYLNQTPGYIAGPSSAPTPAPIADALPETQTPPVTPQGQELRPLPSLPQGNRARNGHPYSSPYPRNPPSSPVAPATPQGPRTLPGLPQQSNEPYQSPYPPVTPARQTAQQDEALPTPQSLPQMNNLPYRSSYNLRSYDGTRKPRQFD